MIGWDQMVGAVAQVYNALPVEKIDCRGITTTLNERSSRFWLG
jgi:hypothetical protein